MATGWGISFMNCSGDVISPRYAGTQRFARGQKLQIDCDVDQPAYESASQGRLQRDGLLGVG